jgi:hypothetical protein
LVDTHRRLTEDGSAVLVRLTTNRLIDPRDPLMSSRDGRDGRLVPRVLAGGPRSTLGQARAAWASEAGTDEHGLTDFFRDFHIESGLDVQDLKAHVALLMTATGLKSDSSSVALALGWLEGRVIAGIRRMDLSDVQGAVAQLGLHASTPWTTLSISTLDHDPLAEHASYAIDVVDRMDGSSPWTRKAPLAPYSWGQLQTEIEAIPRVLNPGRVLVTGYMRQATGFLIGTQLRDVRGYTAAVEQRGQLWDTTATTHSVDLSVDERWVGAGEDLAVITQIAFPGADDALSWIVRNKLPVRSVLILSAHHPSPTAISSAEEANSIAVELRNRVRASVRGVDKIHLFQMGPLGLAVLLGHHWSRLRPTYVYEHIDGDEYVRSFQIDA